jgi:hypothetical protein
MQFYYRAYLTYKDKCSMNLRYRNMGTSVATLRGAPQKRSTPEVKDKWRTIPLGRNPTVRRALLAAELVLIPEEDRRSKIFPRVINSKNSGRPNHPPLTVK